jgi:patatin-like phospholipase/acyl hydrolase
MAFFILSIDGGGIRGIIPSVVLVELKRRLAQRDAVRPLHRYFDLIAGTSTGGIVAAALAAPRPGNPTQPAAEPEELVELYEQHGGKIFDRNFFTHLREVFRNLDCIMQEKYNANQLEKILQQKFGRAKVSDALTHLVLTAYDIEARNAVIITNTKPSKGEHTDDYLLWQAVRATTAAPTYFEPARVHNITHDRAEALIDGGMFATDPSLIAFVEAVKLGQQSDDIVMLSVGTGYQNRHYRYEDAKDWGPLNWINPAKATPILSILMQGTASCTSHAMDRMLNDYGGTATRYFRIDGDLCGCKDEMDDASEQNIRDLKRLAGQFIDTHDAKLTAVVDLLSHDKAAANVAGQ